MSDTENCKEQKPRWGERQLGSEVTSGQNFFDVSFGVVLPIICLLADPIVFKGGTLMGGGMFARYALPAYLFLGALILGMAFWLATRRLGLYLAGPFHVGAVIAAGIGVALLPLSLLMVLAGIGLLGLVPIGTAFTFFRNAVRAQRMARQSASEAKLLRVGVLTALLAIGVPTAAHVYVQHQVTGATTAALSDDATEQAAGVATLRRIHRLLPGTASLDTLVWRWKKERDPAHKARLAVVYQGATDQEIEYRLYELED